MPRPIPERDRTAPSILADSKRLSLRRGDLARERRPDPDGELAVREPDELYDSVEPIPATRR